MDILIIKIGALGDVLRSSFIAQALKDKYKDQNPRIYWITSKAAEPLLTNNPYISKIVLEQDINTIRTHRFDLIINLEEDKILAEFVSSLKKDKILGVYLQDNNLTYSKEGKDLFDMSLISKYGKRKADLLKLKNKKTHRQLIGELIGIDWKKYEPFFRLNKNQREIASNFSRRYNISKSDIVLGINTGSADRWPKALSVEKTAKLIDHLYKNLKAKILIFGGPNEVERNKEIISQSHSPVIDTGCGNDLIEFPALIGLCSIVISTDSLGLHVALALKRKIIALIGPTSPTEIDLCDLGEKIIAKSKDVCSYKTKTDCMEKIDTKEIVSAVEKIIFKKITLVITAFKEPKTIGKAIEGALNQKTKYAYDILVSAPDKKTLDIAKKYAKSNKNINMFKDPGKGKSLALNMIFKKINTDIIILTDGDVSINDKVVEEIVNLFLDPEIGCVTGRPVPIEDRSTKYGYWANFLFEAAHKIRKDAFEKHAFIECSGYLFAFRKNKISSIPLDVAEDTVIPYYFWEKGYKIGYAEKAEVYVKNVDNLQDWLKQKIRTGKAHETLHKYVNTKTTKRVKSFKNESKGIYQLLKHPTNPKEFFWALQLALARLWLWGKIYLDTKILDKNYGDAWQRVESTK